MKKFWNWTNEAETDSKEPVARLELYGSIASESWFDDDVTPGMFKSELEAHPGNIELYISSPGGDVEAATQIYTMLMEHKGHVCVKIDGVAASASTIVAMAGTTVLMAPSAMMMIHNPACVAYGDVAEMKSTIKMLNTVKDAIIDVYRTKCNLTKEEISDLMDKETWMSSDVAIEYGFADGIIEKCGEKAVSNHYQFSTRAVTDKLVHKAVTEAPIEDKKADDSVSYDELIKQLYKIL